MQSIALCDHWSAPLRKLPVTPEMLRWLLCHLRSSGYPTKDQTIIKAALLTGWFFMLRASELLPQPDGEDRLGRALRPSSIVFYKNGEPCRGVEADEVVIQVRSAKNDQHSRGQARSHHRSGDEPSPVGALARRNFDERTVD